METWSVIASVLGALGVVSSIVFAYIAFSKGGKKDSSEAGEKNGVILTELGYIKANTDEIKAEQREQRKVNTELYSRMAAVEASAKQAHKRLDEVIGRAKDD